MDRSGSTRLREGKGDVFRGNHKHAIDAKGRTSLPAKFREALATVWAAGETPTLMVTQSPLEPCLRAYPMPEWTKLEEKLSEQATFNRNVAALLRLLVGGAQETPVDKLGRMLVAPTLREYAGLSKEVVFVGTLKFIEIWDAERFEAWRREQQEGEKRELLAESLGELRI